jgi:hypothetical protein
VTERHILYALAAKFTIDDLPRHFLLGVFKSCLVESFYMDADDELPHITDFISLAERLGAVPAYAYLGDVGVSVTGDKKPQKFEDSCLDELLSYLSDTGIRAVTYMPARNTEKQLARIKALCESHGFLQISGEDINMPLQSFVCEKIETPEFKHLINSAWALIGHELAATKWSKSRTAPHAVSPHTEIPSGEPPEGLFSAEIIKRLPKLNDRIDYFVSIAKNHYRSATKK